MPDLSVEIEARGLTAPLATSLLDDLKAFAFGTLVTLAMAVVGTVVVTIGLTLAVVASPLIAAGIGVAILHHRRAPALTAGAATS